MSMRPSLDSFSPFDPSEIFDPRQRPVVNKNFKIASEQTQKIPKDTMKIFTKEDLSRDAMSRLGVKEKYMIPQNGFVRIGKYVFTGIFFLPYFTFFAVPKWIVVEALPMIFNLSTQMMEKLLETAKKPAAVVSAQAKKLSHYIKNIAFVFIDPVVRFYLEVRRRVIQKIHQAIEGFQSLFKPSSKLLTNLKEKALGFLSYIKDPVSRAGQLIEKGKQEVAGFFNQGIIKLKTFLHLALNWGQQLLLKTRESPAFLLATSKAKFEKLSDRAEKSTLSIFNFFHRIAIHISQIFSPLTKLYQKGLKPGFSKGFRLFKGLLKKGEDSLFKKSQQFQALFLQFKKKMERLTFDLFIYRLVNHALFSKLPAKIQQAIKKIVTHPVIYRVGHVSFGLLSLIGQGFFSLAAHALTYLARLAELSKSFILIVLKGLSQGFAYLKACVSSLCLNLKIFSKILIYHFLLVVMILFILVKLGLRGVVDLTAAIMKNINFVENRSR